MKSCLKPYLKTQVRIIRRYFYRRLVGLPSKYSLINKNTRKRDKIIILLYLIIKIPMLHGTIYEKDKADTKLIIKNKRLMVSCNYGTI